MTAPTFTADGVTYTITGDTMPSAPADAYVANEYLVFGDPRHVHWGPTPVFRSFVMFADGSGCVACVNVWGRVVRCEYFKGEFRAHDLPPKRDKTAKWKITNAVKLAREAFKARFEQTAPDGWVEKHAELYA